MYLSFYNGQCLKWGGKNYSDGRPCFDWHNILTKKKKNMHVMRALLLLELGPLIVTQPLEACHTCHNENCVNRKHGFWGTHQQNMSGWIP